MIGVCVSKSIELRSSIGTVLFCGPGLCKGAPVITVSLFLRSKEGGNNVEEPVTAFCCAHSNVRLDVLGVFDVVNDLNFALSLSPDC